MPKVSFLLDAFTDAAVTLAFSGEFGRGVGTIQLANVACIGNETSLLNCTNQEAAVCSSHTRDVGVDCLGRLLRKFHSIIVYAGMILCSWGVSYSVTAILMNSECVREKGGRERGEREREGGGGGRRERDSQPFILSHTALPPTIGFDRSTGSDFILMEGESIQLCVVLLSGSIPFEFTFDVEIRRFFEQPRGRKWLLL